MQCIAMVTSPTLRGTNKLTVYGTLEIGEVPRLAAMENATPQSHYSKPCDQNNYASYDMFLSHFSFERCIPRKRKIGNKRNGSE